MNLQSINASASPEVQMNENFETLDALSVYGKRQAVTTGLTWGYYGGRWGGFSISASTLALTDSTTNYVVVLRSTGAISTSATATNWNNTSSYLRAYKLTTAGGVVTAAEDHRAGPHGVLGQAMAPVQNPQSIAYLTVLADANNDILHPAADTTARTFTIDSNANVPYPVSTRLTFINQNAAGVMTIAIATDTMRLSPGGTTGSRTLAANGIAVAIKVTSTEWIISGSGLT